MRGTAVLLVLVSVLPLEAAFERRDASARVAAMGGAGAAVADEAAAVFDNPAGLSFVKSLNVALGGREVFPSLDLPEPVTLVDAAVALPVHPVAVLAVAGRTFGLPLYRETEAGLAASFQVQRRWAVAALLKYLEVSGRELAASRAFGIDVGAVVKPAEQVRLGAVFRNLNAPAVGGSPDNTSRGGELGVSFAPASGILFAGSVLFDTDAPDGRLSFRAGGEWRFLEWMALRLGFDSGRSAVTAGFGGRYRWLAFDYALVQNAVTGAESVMTLSFDLSESRRSVFREPPRKKRTRMTLEDLGPEREYTGEKLDINRATAEELQALPRIGPSTARKIVEYRERYGPFRRKEDIMKVPGIGVRTYARFRELITVGVPEEEAAAEGERKGPDISTVTLRQLIDLKVPPMVAVKIIKHRDEKGPIRSFDDLRQVEGLTEEDLRQIKPLIEHLFR